MNQSPQSSSGDDAPAGPAVPEARLLAAAEQRPYGLVFWLCYLANMTLTLGFSLLFRYADFIFQIGGNEMQLGLIVGVGMIGALVMRGAQGVGLDRFGPRLVWLVSLALFTASCLLHLAITRPDTPPVYLVRILLTIGTAGAFGASLTYISLRVPESRVAEMIGTLGSSGFIGMALGPALGDLLFRNGQPTRDEVNGMFLAAAAASAISMLLVVWGTRQEVRPRRRRRAVPLLWIVRRYHPGPMLSIGVAMGLGIGLPHVFLRAYTQELGIGGIRTFFLVYAATAFAVRLLTRRWCDELGTRPLVLMGMAALIGSMLLYLVVASQALLAAPAVLAGVAHAFLFPAVIGGGSTSFPSRYRGVATTLMLSTFDIGNLLGQPAIGGLIHASRQLGLPPYPTMFICVALVLVAISLDYAWRSRHDGRPPAAGRAATARRGQRRSGPRRTRPAAASAGARRSAAVDLPRSAPNSYTGSRPQRKDR